jgi:hypothetical protein
MITIRDGLLRIWMIKKLMGVADAGYLSRISDPNYVHPRSQDKKNPDPGSASRNLSIFDPKNWF